MVTVKGHVDQVVIVAGGQVIATHPRCLERHTMMLEPIHYLATLGRKPGALDHSPVYRDWKLPACFADFRAELRALHGTLAGDRRFVRILQLLGEHPLERVRQAVEACRLDQLISAEAVIQRTSTLGAIESRLRGGSSVFKCKTSRIGPSGPWPSGGCARSSSQSLATPDSSPGSIGPTDSSLTSVHRYAW